MRICICVNGRAHEGGVTSYINSVSDGLRTLGHQVDVVTLFGISQYRKTKNTLVETTDKLLLGSPKKTLVLYTLSKIILGLRLILYCLFKKWDVIFAQDTSVVNAGRIAGLLFKIPITLVVHGSVPQALIHQGKIQKGDFVWRFMVNEEKRAYRQAKKIIANSTYTADYISSICPEIKNINIIRNLVDEKKFYPNPEAKNGERKNLKISLDAFIVLFVGRLTELKGVIYLLMAFKKIAIDPKIIVVCVGDGPEKSKLEDYIKTNKLNNQVKILGSIPYADVGKIYHIANVLVVPSITLGDVQEPLGIVALEGMATGIPVISFGVGGLKEIIKDGYNGILVPEKDTDQLAQAILKIKNNPELVQELIRNGEKMIQENYTTKIVAGRLTEIFQKSLSK